MKGILTLLLICLSAYCFGQSEFKINIYNKTSCPVYLTLATSTFVSPLGTVNCAPYLNPSSIISIPPMGFASFGYAMVPGLPSPPSGYGRNFLGAKILNGPPNCSGVTYQSVGWPCAGMGGFVVPVSLRDNSCANCGVYTAQWTIPSSGLAELTIHP